MEYTILAWSCTAASPVDGTPKPVAKQNKPSRYKAVVIEAAPFSLAPVRFLDPTRRRAKVVMELRTLTGS